MGLPPFPSPPKSPFEPPTLLYRLSTSPLHFALQAIHSILTTLRGAPFPAPSSPIRIVCISDTHTHKPPLPPGDILIHAGDLTNQGSISELQAQLDWLSSQPHAHVVAIAGNHDSYFDPSSRRAADKGLSLDFKRVKYLQHSGVTLTFPAHADRKLTIHGAPQIPACGGQEMAFQYERGDDAWSGTLPADVDVLVTHTPPKFHLDLPVGLGCEFLGREVWRVRPRLHVFGHVHGGRGREVVFWGRGQEAFERLCAAEGVWSWVGMTPWVDVARVLVHGLLGIAWSRVWGAEEDASVMVNAGVVDWRTRLRYGAQVVEI
ncbi:MAG: hypothetical protein MMC23_001933 [Stictis urceolatum]|nr:hypothetical protein [Stictis urceolata]